MCEVLYTDYEGGLWRRLKCKYWSEEEIKRICEAQKLDHIDSYNRVKLPGNCDVEYIEAAAVMFHDGFIWDAILSGYDTCSRKRNRKNLRWLPLAYKGWS